MIIYLYIMIKDKIINNVINYCSIQNKRPYNEDEIYINSIPNNKNINLYSVFDGHGGKFVSKFLLKDIPKYMLNDDINYESDKSKIINEKIKNYFEYIQCDLENQKFSKNMGSTCLIAVIYYSNNKLKLKAINLGDSRMICCNKYNIAIPLTLDHKPDHYIEKSRITQIGGIVTNFDCPRIQGLATSRAFGDLDTKPYVSHIPDIFDYELNNIKYVVLACDGLWDVLSNQDVVNFINEELYLNNDKKQNISKKLADYAIKKGSTDNISIIIIYI